MSFTFAKIDETSTVEAVTTVYDPQTEEEARAFLFDFSQGHTNWILLDGSSYKHYPQGGFTWDSQRNEFLPPKMYPSWILNEQDLTWEAPVPYPSDPDKIYVWNEDLQQWEEYIPDNG